MTWVVYALLAAGAGALVAVLTKTGLKDIDPGVALAVQSVLILLLAWATVLVQGSLSELSRIGGRAWVSLLISGVLIGASYLLIFHALKHGDAARVVPVDRLSLIFAIALGAIFLKERVGMQVILGGLLMAAGALLIALARP
jgi:bacterial/archaeal transporter family protein